MTPASGIIGPFAIATAQTLWTACTILGSVSADDSTHRLAAIINGDAGAGSGQGGVGDVCPCGDVNGSGSVTSADADKRFYAYPVRSAVSWW